MKHVFLCLSIFLINALFNNVLGSVFVCNIRQESGWNKQEKIVIQYSDKNSSEGLLIPWDRKKNAFNQKESLVFRGKGTVNFNQKENDLYITQYWSDQMYLTAFFNTDFYELVSLRIAWGSKGKKMPISIFTLGAIGDPFWRGFCEKF